MKLESKKNTNINKIILSSVVAVIMLFIGSYISANLEKDMLRRYQIYDNAIRIET